MKAILLLSLSCIAFGSSAKSNFRIVGNSYAMPGEFPYLVSIQLDGKHHCGGCLIGKKHVLTAAHCVWDLIASGSSLSRMKVITGTNTLPGGMMYDISRIARHPSYVHSETDPILKADVAVIRLKIEVIESPYVKIASLPRQTDVIYNGQKLKVSGFGASELYGPSSPDLKMMPVFSTSWDTCQRHWPKLSSTPGIFCASLAPGYGVCHGDSGGPVVSDDNIVYGIVSATSGRGCGTGVPDVFTYVPNYIDFILTEVVRVLS